MTEILLSNGGTECDLEDIQCTHVVSGSLLSHLYGMLFYLSIFMIGKPLLFY